MNQNLLRALTLAAEQNARVHAFLLANPGHSLSEFYGREYEAEQSFIIGWRLSNAIEKLLPEQP